MTHAAKRQAVDVMRELLARSFVGDTGTPTEDLARAIFARARSAEGCKAVTVLVDDDTGAVYAPKATAQGAILAAHVCPGWLVGTYSVASSAVRIAKDLRRAIDGTLPRDAAPPAPRASQRVVAGWGYAA